MSGFAIRPEAPADIVAIHALLEAAFGGPLEAALVDRLRADDDLPLALVAVGEAAAIVGYAGFPRLRIDENGTVLPAIGLAPLAVAASHRRQGIGAALVRTGLDQLRERGERLAFVLGDPAYYHRFGFSAEAAQPFGCVYAGPHFMALGVAQNAPRRGTVRYPAAFDDVG